MANDALRLELETLHGRHEVLKSFVTTLRVAPYKDALEALRRLRSSTSGWPANKDAPARPPKASSSAASTALDLTPPPSEPAPAPCTPPSDVCEIIQDQLYTIDQPYCAHDQGPPALPDDASLSLVKTPSDPRLKGLDISFWTAVSVTDIFAKDAISSYLRSDHGIWELFDANTFLSDLVSQKSDFCSAFLVNCLLAFASQTYATTCPGATSKGFQFEEAAGVLWQAEATRLDSETALTGLTLLYLCFTTRWESNNADECLRQVFEMAVRMKLFGVSERISDFDMSFLQADRRSSMVHAAWGAFNTMSMHRKRLLGDVFLLPPLVAFPSMASSITNVSEHEEVLTDHVVQVDPGV